MLTTNHLGISDYLDEQLFMNLRLDEKHTCPDCLDTFGDQLSLVHHRTVVCGLDLMYECIKCHRRFKYNHNLKAHGVTCLKQKKINKKNLHHDTRDL